MYWFIIFLLPFYSHAISIEQWAKYPPSSSFEYEFFDIDEADIPPDKLSVYALPTSLAPIVNDKRQIAYNKEQASFLREFSGKQISPHVSSISGYIHSLDNAGNLLTVFKRSQHDTFWELWHLQGLKHTKTTPIYSEDILGNHLYLRSLSDGKVAVGSFKASGALRPLIWSAREGLHHLGYYLGFDLLGIAWDVNSQGTLVGTLLEREEEGLPFAWNATWGLERLKTFVYRLQQQTRRRVTSSPIFSDLTIASNGYIYGTFYLQGDLTQEHKAFWWDPASDELRFIDLKGMRINKICDQTLVGSWQGQAALCDVGSSPIALKELIKGQASGWELINATSINSYGDIVGYGHYQGTMRYFALKRLNLKKPQKPLSPKEAL